MGKPEGRCDLTLRFKKTMGRSHTLPSRSVLVKDEEPGARKCTELENHGPVDEGYINPQPTEGLLEQEYGLRQLLGEAWLNLKVRLAVPQRRLPVAAAAGGESIRRSICKVRQGLFAVERH